MGETNLRGQDYNLLECCVLRIMFSRRISSYIAKVTKSRGSTAGVFRKPHITRVAWALGRKESDLAAHSTKC